MGGNTSAMAHLALVVSAPWRGEDTGMMARFAAILVGLCLVSGPAMSGEAHKGYDLIFRGGTLSDFAPGDALHYASRTENEAAAPEASANETYALTLEEGGKVRLMRLLDEGEQPVAGFDASVGNPMAMFFLERLVRDLADATGGSTFYIRNRLKESLLEPETIRDTEITWAGVSHPAQAVVLAPFVGDEHAARLGPFAELRVVFDLSSSVPGWYHMMRAETPERAGASRFFQSTLRLKEPVK
ncbi:hypothetical protein [uncultured Roseovarius sp.]|uniref:hypothetical protein n=1 Tax=uncultured Roseovarius sp. TaxID=293344 RepID=UPI0026179E6F|nr:hypothetical protein [uncultured Roseovarius sp.]